MRGGTAPIAVHVDAVIDGDGSGMFVSALSEYLEVSRREEVDEAIDGIDLRRGNDGLVAGSDQPLKSGQCSRGDEFDAGICVLHKLDAHIGAVGKIEGLGIGVSIKGHVGLRGVRHV